MDLMEAIYGRRAVREYAPEPVANDVVVALIDAAVHAPNAMNRQPWAFTVVRDRALLDRCSASAKAHLVATLESHPELAGLRERLAAPDFNIFYDAPALIVISATEPDPLATVDCSLAAQNLMLAAHSRGLGTCWIGLAQAWLSTDEGKTQLGVPHRHSPVAPLILGRPRRLPERTLRRAPDIRWIGD